MLWSLIFIKLLIYDFDNALLGKYAPQYLPLLKYKFFGVLGAIALLWVILGKQRFRSTVAYVLFYPVIVLIYKIPKHVFRNWAVVIAFSPAVHSIATSFRWTFVSGVCALISALTVLISENQYALWTSVVVLLLYFGRHLARRFRMAFRPSTVFADIGKIIRSLSVPSQSFIEHLNNANKQKPGSEAHEKHRLQNLLSLYLFNSVLHLLAEKTHEVINSRKLDLYFIGSLLYTVFLTIFVFAFEYTAVHKLLPGSFSGEADPSFWNFLGYSFETLMIAGPSSLKPVSTTAHLLSYGEMMSRLIILVILVFVILTIVRERYREDAVDVIAELRKSAESITQVIRQEYSLSLLEAEQFLQEENPVVVEWFGNLRSSKQTVGG